MNGYVSKEKTYVAAVVKKRVLDVNWTLMNVIVPVNVRRCKMASRPKRKKAWRENYKPGYKKLKTKLGSIHDKLPKKTLGV